MTRPHSACWIIAATAMIVLMSPSPAGVSVTVTAVSGEAPAAGACSAVFDAAIGPWAVERLLTPYPVEIAPSQLPAYARELGPLGHQGELDPALGPWDVDRLLCPYPETMGLEQLAELAPQPVMPAASLPQQPSAPIDSDLGPWRIEQFACPYQITMAVRRPDETVVQTPLPAPVTLDPALGPWDVERLLHPYPDAVAPVRLGEFSRRPAEPMGPAALADEPRAHVRIVMRVAGTGRKLLGLVEDGAQAARKVVKDLRQPARPTLEGQDATPDRGGQAMSTQTDDAREGLKQGLHPGRMMIVGASCCPGTRCRRPRPTRSFSTDGGPTPMTVRPSCRSRSFRPSARRRPGTLPASTVSFLHRRASPWWPRCCCFR